ncbi:threonine/serine ThrE exporter family protein [Nocardia thailandica]
MTSPPPHHRRWSTASHRFRRTVTRLAGRFDDALGAPAGSPPAVEEEQEVPGELLTLLCRVGVALIGAGETSATVQNTLNDLAARYGAHTVHFMVLPTAVFVRVRTTAGSSVDMLDAEVGTLPLDQIAGLYRLLDRIQDEVPPPAEADRELTALLSAKPGSPPWLILLGQVVLTVGLGMMLNPAAQALVGYVVLGLVVGVLTQIGDRVRLLSYALPVVAAAAVAALSFGFPEALSGGNPTQLLVPAVATLLPGTMLTNGTIELANGSMVAGASRIVYGINMLFLLSFGLYVGISVLGDLPPAQPESSQLGWWAPLIGVLLIGIGHSWRSSAPKNSLGWLLVVLWATFAAQAFGKFVSGPLTGAFLGGLVAVPAAYLIRNRSNAPPPQVAFLPAFWMLVPGGISLQGVSELVLHTTRDVGVSGLEVMVSALLSVMSIALGVMVGSGLIRTSYPHMTTLMGTAHPSARVESWLARHGNPRPSPDPDS